MLIYIFVDNFPNPYKPYYDTQFAYLVSKGHEIRIFAESKYTETQNEEVSRYKLDRLTSYYPTTLKTIPRFLVKLLWSAARHPLRLFRQLHHNHPETMSRKENMMCFMRALLLPREEPHLCLIHNLSTTARFPFLKQQYPASTVVMYFHGGEVARTPRVQNSQDAFSSVDLVFTNTDFSRKQAVSRGCLPAKIQVVPVGFNLKDYSSGQARDYRSHGQTRLISVGRMADGKGYIYALQALKMLIGEGYTNLQYTIIGAGYLLGEIKSYIEINKLERWVSIAGEKSKTEVISALRKSDILILPSVATDTWAETQACVVQEAMLMRLLVITTNTGGVPESIPTVMQQFAVAEHDSKAIADKIRKIIGMSAEEITETASVGRRFVEDNYEIGKVSEKLLALSLGASAAEIQSS